MKFRTKIFWLLSAMLIATMALTSCATTPDAPADDAAAPADDDAAPADDDATSADDDAAPADDAVEPLIIGIGYNYTIDDGAWSEMWYNIQLAIEEHFGEQVKVIFAENVPYSEESGRIFEQFVSDGATFLIDTGGFGDPVNEVAARNPETVMEVWGGFISYENQYGLWYTIEDIGYLHGVAAGMLTESNQIGYLGPFAASYVKSHLNAFALGVQSVNPDAIVSTVMYGAFNDPPAARAATEALIAAGADVIGGFIVEPAAHQVAEDMGVWVTGGDEGIGILGAFEAFAPTKFVSAKVLDFSDFYIERIQMAMDGTWVGNMDTLIVEIGNGVDLSDFGPNVPQDVVDAVLAVRQQFVDGWTPYVGPLTDTTGAIVVAEGEEVSRMDFWYGLEWVLQGVTGMGE